MSATTPRLDGCPQACGNTELPWFVEAVPGAIRASYTCADCGERWTTDWAVETVAQMFETRPVTSANGGPAWEDRGEAKVTYLAVRDPASNRLQMKGGG